MNCATMTSSQGSYIIALLWIVIANLVATWLGALCLLIAGWMLARAFWHAIEDVPSKQDPGDFGTTTIEWKNVGELIKRILKKNRKRYGA